MAQLTPGVNLTDGDRLTVSKAHSLVDSSFLVNVKNADLSNCRLIYTSSPAIPSTGDVRVGSDGRLEFYYGATWNTQPTEDMTLSLTNKSGSDLVLGDVVCWDHTNSASFTIASLNPAPDVCGVLAANIANNATGLVYVRGLVTVRVAVSGFSLVGALLRGPNGTSGTSDVRIAATAAVDGRSDIFGVLFQSVSIGPTNRAAAYIWK